MDEMAEKLGHGSGRIPRSSTTRRSIPRNPSGPSRSAHLVECLRVGADTLRLEQAQSDSPAQTRDGRWLVGMGMAAAFRNNLLVKVRRARPARQSRRRDGRDRHDRHRHRQLHDHRADRGRDDGRAARQGRGPAGRFQPFPVSCGSGGQFGANNSTSGVFAACMKLREAVARKLGFNPADAVFADGKCARATAACRSPKRRRTASSSPRTPSNMATSTRRISNRPSARISSKSASMP